MAVFNIFLAAFGLEETVLGEMEQKVSGVVFGVGDPPPGCAVVPRTQTPKTQVPFTHPLQLLTAGRGTNGHLIWPLVKSRSVSLVALRSRFDRVILAEVDL